MYHCFWVFASFSVLKHCAISVACFPRTLAFAREESSKSEKSYFAREESSKSEKTKVSLNFQKNNLHSQILFNKNIRLKRDLKRLISS